MALSVDEIVFVFPTFSVVVAFIFNNGSNHIMQTDSSKDKQSKKKKSRTWAEAARVVSTIKLWWAKKIVLPVHCLESSVCWGLEYFIFV